MSFSDMTGTGRGSEQVPAWAQRANENLLPTVDLPAIKKSVAADVKEITKAAEKLAKLGKAGSTSVGQQLLEVSSAARERARGTTRVLKEALANVPEGSSDARALNTLSEQFKQALLKFQREVERTSHLVGPQAGGAPDLERGGGAGASGVAPLSAAPGWGSANAEPAAPVVDQQTADMQMQVQGNEAMIADREQAIGQLNRSVQEVADIFQDLALLVNEQGTHIDNIQTNIEQTATRTEAGVRELARASQYQRRAKTRICIIIACVLAVIVILVIVLKYGLKKI